VTSIVAAAGAGTYTTANVQLGTGLSDSSSGRWALIVAYGDPSPSATMRNLSVFDGMQTVGSAGAVTIPLSGFRTPLSGPVSSTVGMVAYEGDLATTGDGAKLQRANGRFSALSNAVNPGSDTVASQNNIFNSTISNAGALVMSRTPSFRNNLGYDADLLTTTNVLGNGQTSTQVQLSTTGDAYQPGVVTIATDLFAPKITATKTVAPAGAANLGGTLTYTVVINNSGQDGAIASTFSDAIPAGPRSSPAASGSTAPR
jgi:large repetitive protein